MLRLCTDNLLISVVLAFVLGAVAAFVFSVDLCAAPLLPALLPVFFLLVLLTWRLPRSLRPLGALPFFFCIGLAHTHLALEPPSDPRHITNFIQEGKPVTLIGRVASMVEFDGQASRFLLQSEEILLHAPPAPFPDRPQPVHGLVRISMAGHPPPYLRPGTSIMALTRLRPIRSYQSPGAFNYRLHMASQDIACTGWAQSGQAILPVDDRTALSPWLVLRSRTERMRQSSALFLKEHFSQEIAGIYEALLIGSGMSSIPPPVLEQFKANGCLHILSISGLHMSMLGLFAMVALRFLLKQSGWLLLHTHIPTMALLLTAPILLLYVFLAGLNTPAVRAFLTALLVLLAVSLRARRSMLHLVAAAALVILAFQPLALFTASFQLSFAAVLAIICIYPRLPLFRRDFSAPPGSGRMGKFFYKAVILAQSMFYVSLAASLGTLPFLLYHFNRFSLIGPVMNLLMEPLLCYWTLPCGLVALPLIDLAPNLAHLILAFGAYGIGLALFLSALPADWPWISLWTITPNWLEISLYFLILPLLLQTGKKRLHWLVILLAGGLLVASFTSGLWLTRDAREARIDVLDVGQGSAALVRLPDGRAILIDGGGPASASFNPGEAVIAPFLWHERLWRVDDVVVSHPHSDHYNGLSFILERFRPQHLIINTDPGTENAYHALLKQAAQAGVKIALARAGDILHEGKGARLVCLGMSGQANEENGWDSNDRSLVLHLQTPWHSMLFPGDITAVAEQRLLDAESLSPVDVLLAPHHGSRHSASSAFIKALSPALIVVSSGAGRKNMFPVPEHLRKWREQRIRYLITAEQGTISIISRADGLLVSEYATRRHPLTGVGWRLPGLPFGAASSKQGKDQAGSCQKGICE